MYKEPIFLEPAFQDRIWGGTKLHTLFGSTIPSDKTGEAWVISAHKNGSSTVTNGPLAGKKLSEVWQAHPTLFGKSTTTEEFPLLVKILDANDDLSVQVHPDDTYARNVAGEQYGKTECWYILDCAEDAEIIFGHHAKSAAEFKQMVDAGEWDNLLKRVKVKKGDFYYVPSGTIHAIGKGIVILETQQSSDITYRVYDYDRLDAQGCSRDLHIREAIEVTNYSAQPVAAPKVEKDIADLHSTRLIAEKYFTVYHWLLNGTVSTPLTADFLLVSVVDGKGEITVGDRTFSIAKGDNFLIPATVERYELAGNVEFIVSHE